MCCWMLSEFRKSLEAEFGDKECALLIGLAVAGSAPLHRQSRAWGLALAPDLGGSRLV